MQRHVALFSGLLVCFTIMLGPNLSARDALGYGQSASINAVATVVEPVGLIAGHGFTKAPAADARPEPSGLALRLPPYGSAVIHLSRGNDVEARLIVRAQSKVVQQIDSDLVRRYEGGTITVIFTEN